MTRPVLVVEDDSHLRDLLREWLGAALEGHEIIAAPGSESAARLVASRSPAVVLIDVDSLATKGASLIRKLKAAAPEASIAALAVDDHEALRREGDHRRPTVGAAPGNRRARAH